MRLMRMISGSVSVMAILILTGCLPVPLPRDVQMSPQVEGRIQKEGRPLTDRRVMLLKDHDMACQSDFYENQNKEKIIASARTDERGQFRISANSRRDTFVQIPLAPVHKMYTMTVCLEGDDEEMYPVWAQNSYYGYQEGLGPLSRTVRLDCSLDVDGLDLRDLKDGGRDFSVCEVSTQGGICDHGGELHAMEKDLPGVCPHPDNNDKITF